MQQISYYIGYLLVASPYVSRWAEPNLSSNLLKPDLSSISMAKENCACMRYGRGRGRLSRVARNRFDTQMQTECTSSVNPSVLNPNGLDVVALPSSSPLSRIAPTSRKLWSNRHGRLVQAVGRRGPGDGRAILSVLCSLQQSTNYPSVIRPASRHSPIVFSNSKLSIDNKIVSINFLCTTGGAHVCNQSHGSGRIL